MFLDFVRKIGVPAENNFFRYEGARMGQGCILEICSQVNGLPCGLFGLAEFQNFVSFFGFFLKLAFWGG